MIPAKLLRAVSQVVRMISAGSFAMISIGNGNIDCSTLQPEIKEYHDDDFYDAHSATRRSIVLTTEHTQHSVESQRLRNRRQCFLCDSYLCPL